MNSKPRPHILLRILFAIEDGMLVTVLLVMILLSFSQIVLRNFAGIGIFWADPLLRYMVLWVGLLGAMVATREYNHINIDLVSHFLPSRAKSIVRIFTDAFTCVVCAFLTYASYIFIQEEMEMGTKAFAQIPTWIAELILPFAFGVISIRYLIYFVIHIIESIKGVSDTQFDNEESN